MKKVLILYHTVYGNTKKIAMALSRGLEAGDLYVDCISIEEFNIEQMKSYDVLGIGGPSHFNGVSNSMKLFLKRLKSLNLENKQGFAFEAKTDFRLIGSTAKKIVKGLKNLNITIIHPIITGIAIDKESPLQEKTLESIEQIGLLISEKISAISRGNIEKQGNKNSSVRSILNYLKWILIGGGPIFFFIRAIQLASLGGDCFGTINPIFSWILLILEIFISGFTAICGILGLVMLNKNKNELVFLVNFNPKKMVLITGISSYVIHFTRVAIWIVLCVI